MSDDFRPLFIFENKENTKKIKKASLDSRKILQEELNKFKSLVSRLEEEKKQAQDRIAILEEELRRLREENERLLKEIEELKREILKRDRKIEELLELIKTKETFESFMSQLINTIENSGKGIKEELKNDFLHITQEIIKEFLLSDFVPKENVVKKILEEVFEKSVDIKGSVKVFLNPHDFSRLKDYIESLKEKLKDKIEIEFVQDSGLKEGEIKIDTPKYIIERKHEEVFEEVFKEVIERHEG